MKLLITDCRPSDDQPFLFPSQSENQEVRPTQLHLIIHSVVLTFVQKHSKILILNKEGDWWKGECDGQVGLWVNIIVSLRLRYKVTCASVMWTSCEKNVFFQFSWQWIKFSVATVLSWYYTERVNRLQYRLSSSANTFLHYRLVTFRQISSRSSKILLSRKTRTFSVGA